MLSALTLKQTSLFSELKLNLSYKLIKQVIILFIICVATIVCWPTSEKVLSGELPVTLDSDSTIQDQDISNELEKPSTKQPQFSFTVARGDTLTKLFAKAGVSKKEMFKVLAADLEILALDTVVPGNKVQFWIDKNGQLQKLELIFNLANNVVYSRYTDGSFQAKELKIEGLWQSKLLSGVISDSFFSSAKKLGVTATQISRISDLLADKVNFNRDLHRGDKFKVLLDQQFVNGEFTGESHIKGIHLETTKGEFSIFQYKDGNFYDENGQSLQTGFLRLPLRHPARVSSPFNPYRVHPITGRVTPHNGVDLAVPVGTPILAAGDGVVRLVTHHPYAGKYVVIEHSDRYTTRYLHLSKSLVHAGQKVKTGQVIALSGNTGRTTGPHLHYEFRIDGRPVDPLIAKIPVIKKLSKQDERLFAQIIHKCKLMMDLV